MTLKDAEKIVHDYGSVLENPPPDDGPETYESSLPHSRETIMQAMKLWLAHEIKNHSTPSVVSTIANTTSTRGFTLGPLRTS